MLLHGVAFPVLNLLRCSVVLGRGILLLVLRCMFYLTTVSDTAFVLCRGNTDMWVHSATDVFVRKLTKECLKTNHFTHVLFGSCRRDGASSVVVPSVLSVMD